ncbi:MAG: integrin alpha [Xanthomonadales bacterium]|nr:integrin alpha [Xanthomonadales bacterium]
MTHRFACLFAALVSMSAVATDIPLGNLPADQGLRIEGLARNDQAGSAALATGDFNGDGIKDLAFSATGVDAAVNGSTAANVGEVYVLFGHPTAFEDPIDLNEIINGDGSRGFAVRGEFPGNAIGANLMGVDLTADGIDELVISSPRSGTTAGNQGIVYILFGKRGSFDPVFPLGRLRTQDNSGTGEGFIVSGTQLNGQIGASLAALEDFNGDGISDLLIGGSLISNTSSTNGRLGQSVILFGRDGTESWPATLRTVDFREDLLGELLGTLITSAGSEEQGGDASLSAGDVNGDGLSDFFFAGPNGDGPNGEAGAGFVDLLAGRSAYGGDIELRVRSQAGILTRFFGEAGDGAGTDLARLGDFNGDGHEDFAISAPFGGADERGRVYILFGRPVGQPWGSDVRLMQLVDSNGAAVISGGPEERIGQSVSATGDVDGDGFDDVLIGAAEGGIAGRAYLVFGRASERRIDLTQDSGVTRFEGAMAEDFAGRSVAGRGDFNADGSHDFTIGSTLADGAVENAGSLHVLFGAGEDAAPPMQGELSHALYDPALPGQGVLLEYGQRNGQGGLFAAWYTFEAGQPIWLVTDLPAFARGQRSLVAPLFVTEGAFFGEDFNSNQVSTEAWGSVRVTQTRCGRILWEYERASDGQAGRLLLRPVLADLLGLDLCALNRDEDTATNPRRQVAGTFWNPDRSGEGILLDLEDRAGPPQLFFSWFTYNQGRQVWLVGSGPMDVVSGRASAIELFEAGGADFGNRFDPGEVALRRWGSVDLEFAGCGTAELNYAGSFAGQNEQIGRIALERFTDGLADFDCN